MVVPLSSLSFQCTFAAKHFNKAKEVSDPKKQGPAERKKTAMKMKERLVMFFLDPLSACDKFFGKALCDPVKRGQMTTLATCREYGPWMN